MQLVIDILTETPSALRLAGQFLLDHAALREAMDAGAGMPPQSGVAPLDPPPPPPAHAVPPPPVDHGANAAEHNVPPPPPSNVVPLPLPLPPREMIAPPSGAPPAPAASPPSGGASYIPAGVPAFDKSGVPYDPRIHQKTGNRKKDGTWKIQKGLDANVVELVMRELAPRINIAEGLRLFQGGAPANSTPPPAGAPAPVSLPQAPPPPPGEAHAAAPPPPPSGEVPPPPGDQTPGAQGPAADPFRALVTKITKARTAQKITPEEITKCYTEAGAPSLQLLNAMPHLIPAVDAAIDAILVLR